LKVFYYLAYVDWGFFHNQFKCNVSLVQVNYMVGLTTHCFRHLSGELSSSLTHWLLYCL